MVAMVLGSNTKFFRHFWKRKQIDFGKYTLIEVGKVSPSRPIPSHIKTPSYYKTGIPTDAPEFPEIKSKEQIQKMRDSCALAANILKAVENTIQAGQTTDDIDGIVHNLAIENGAYPSPLNYRHFPKSVCTSVNNVACHGIPDDRRLEDGDIINVDVTVFLNGYHGDCSKTLLIGNVDEIGRKLVKATELCVHEAITNVCKPGASFWHIGSFIEQRARDLGFNIIPAFAGHGIGEYFHGPPDIYHISNYYPGQMEAGMTFTIEPILTCGGPEIEILEDNWTAITVDSSRTAQHEHTVLITEHGAEILTQPT